MHSLVSARKKKMGIFEGPQIRQLIQDKNFAQSMTPVERDAWLSFVSVTKNFLGKTKIENYVHLVNDMPEKFHRLNVHMSIKIHFLFSDVDRFPEYLELSAMSKGKDFSKIYRSLNKDVRVGGTPILWLIIVEQ